MFSIETRHSLTLVNGSYLDIDKPLRIKKRLLMDMSKEWLNGKIILWRLRYL